MVKLTDTDALVAARCAAPGWIRWAQSNRDGRAHAFPIEDTQQGRWVRAVCSHTIPPAALSTTGVSIRCARCALTVTAARTARHRALRRGGCARLRAWVLGWVRGHRDDLQSPPLAPVAGSRLSLTPVHHAPRDGRTAAMVGSGIAAGGGLVAPRPVYHYPGVAR